MNLGGKMTIKKFFNSTGGAALLGVGEGLANGFTGGALSPIFSSVNGLLAPNPKPAPPPPPPAPVDPNKNLYMYLAIGGGVLVLVLLISRR